MLQRLTLRARLLISICSVILGAFIITNLIVMINVANNTTKEAIDKTKQMSGRYTNEIRATIDEALVTARTLAESFEGMKYSQIVNRDVMNSILKRVLEDNQGFLGVWTCWEPNALDGQDKENINKPGHDGTGRFIPYWNRDNSGKIVLVPLVDYTTEGAGDYYLLARNSGEETIMNPFGYEINGKEVLMTSIVVPIEYDGKVVGVTGVDLTLDSLQTLVNQIKPYGTGYASLVANNLTYITHPDSALLGKAVENAKEIVAAKKVLASDSGEIEVLENRLKDLNGNVYQAFATIHFGRSKTPWVFITNSPVDQVLANVRRASLISIFFSIIFLIILTLVVLMVTNGIVNPLNYIMMNLKNGAAQVSAASGQLSSAAQQLSEGSAEQACAIEETSSTLQESASMMQQSTVNIAQASQLSQQAKTSSDKGGQEMQEMMDSITEIKKSSDRIAKIIKVVDDIAFQTNLLALNAAVEAARAGEAGMGFAVVAEEVRNLAGRSAQAAKETTDIIESNIALSDKGVMVAGRVREALAEITAQAGKVNDLMAEITAASVEQTQGIEQVNRAISQMETVVQQNSANAEESASAAEELSTQAASMNQIVAELTKLVNGSKSAIDEQGFYEVDRLRLTQNNNPRIGSIVNNNRRLTDKAGNKTR